MLVKQISNNIKFCKVKYYNNQRALNYNGYNIFYTLKFYTLYLPSSVKDIRLYSRYGTQDKRDKILIKQSYLILIWLKYITLTNSSMDRVGSLGNATTHLSKKVPSFIVYPCRLYKFTTIKSPMAHKTFSQEQFLCKNYKLSISFNSVIGHNNSITLVNTNSSLYFITFFFQRMPSISTNMFLIQRSTLRFFSRDTVFFSLFCFK